jgi:MFS family permease
LVPLMMSFAFGMALANTGITALISNKASDKEQGTVLGVSSSLDSLSGTISPPLSTGLLSHYGSRVAGAESLVFSVVALGMGLFAARGETSAPAPRYAEGGETPGTLGIAGEMETAEIADV